MNFDLSSFFSLSLSFSMTWMVLLLSKVSYQTPRQTNYGPLDWNCAKWHPKKIAKYSMELMENIAKVLFENFQNILQLFDFDWFVFAFFFIEENYFLDSANKIHYFYENDALDANGNLLVEKIHALNKVAFVIRCDMSSLWFHLFYALDTFETMHQF